MGKNFRETFTQQMQDPEFEEAWLALEPEFQVMKAMVDNRQATNLTQKELAKRVGITQADISRLECGEGNPSLRTLKRIAAGMGMSLKLEFVPLQPAEIKENVR